MQECSQQSHNTKEHTRRGTSWQGGRAGQVQVQSPGSRAGWALRALLCQWLRKPILRLAALSSTRQVGACLALPACTMCHSGCTLSRAWLEWSQYAVRTREALMRALLLMQNLVCMPLLRRAWLQNSTSRARRSGYCAGFGSRMLAKMGYGGQGSGLGRQQQGRADPITATMRPKQLGLGAT